MSDGIAGAEQAVHGQLRDRMKPAIEERQRVVVDAIKGWLQPARGGTLEDWGCGSAHDQPWAKQYVDRMQYVGIDIAPGGGVDVVQNLVYRRSACEAILMHYVLGVVGEYWDKVLANAFESYRQRMLIVEYPGAVDMPRLMQVVQSFARPFTVEVLPDGSRMFKIER